MCGNGTESVFVLFFFQSECSIVQQLKNIFISFLSHIFVPSISISRKCAEYYLNIGLLPLSLSMSSSKKSASPHSFSRSSIRVNNVELFKDGIDSMVDHRLKSRRCGREEEGERRYSGESRLHFYFVCWSSH